MGRNAVMVLVVCTVIVLASGSTALAGRCSGISNPVFCDDFDRWCASPPADPSAACDCTVAPDQDAFDTSWPVEGECSGVWEPHRLTADNPYSWKSCYPGKTPPEIEGYGLKVFVHENASPPLRLARRYHDMTPEIVANSRNNNGYTAFNGAGLVDRAYAAYPQVDPAYVDSMDRDLRPDTLKGQFFMYMGTCGHYGQMVYYTELSLDGDHAPVNFVTVECDHAADVDGTYIDCYPNTCDRGELKGMPCTSDAQCRVGPTRQVLQATDGQTHKAFAVGAVAQLDGTPCYEGSYAWPQAMWRLIVYDGYQWRQLQAPRFDLPMTPGDIQPDNWDLRHWDGWNLVYFAIGADHIEIRLRNTRSESYHATTRCVTDCGENKCMGGRLNGSPCTNDAQCNDLSDLPPGTTQPPALPYPYFVARVERQYKGPFNRISLGSSKGVDTISPTCVNYGTEAQPWKRCRGGENDNGVCETDTDCLAATTEVCLTTFQRAHDVGLEDVVLYDGVFEPHGVGACCTCEAGQGCTCAETSQETCQALGGTFHLDELCSTALCCPLPFADADADSDVDQSDFAAFQTCFTGPQPTGGVPAGCGCWERTGDQAIDGYDFAEFEKCATGPSVPWDQQLTPDCTP